jgi:6-pyruvoyltetrahydropterin/6-carboxytetrahydropterin synthase
MKRITAERYHDISAGHRVVGHENKCRHLHGHNYRIHFVCEAAELDTVGRVIDFGVIKEKLCMWVENNWDHKFLAWEKDHVMQEAYEAMQIDQQFGDSHLFGDSFVFTPFNPTAENIAKHFVEVVAPMQLKETGCTLIRCKVEETRKCSATYEIKNQ